MESSHFDWVKDFLFLQSDPASSPWKSSHLGLEPGHLRTLKNLVGAWFPRTRVYPSDPCLGGKVWSVRLEKFMDIKFICSR